MNAEDYTASQAKIIARITAAGYAIKTMSMIGRKVWIVAERNRGIVFLDESLHGTIGVRGNIDLKYEQFQYRECVSSNYQLANRLK